MLPSKETLSKLLGTLYEAAGEASLWSVFLRELALTTKSNQAGILLHDLGHGDHSVVLNWGIDPAAVRSYQNYYGTCDIWMQRAAPLVHAGWLAISEQVSPFEELRHSEFYNDYLRPNEMAHAMWGVIKSSRSRIMNIGLYRDLRRATFCGKDLELLRFLAPHLDRASHLYLQLSELKSRANDLQYAVDTMATGIIFLGSGRRIIHMNQAATKILTEKDGLLAIKGGLHAEILSEETHLENLIAQAEATTMGTSLAPAGGITISRRGRPALQVLVTPVRNVNLGVTCPVYAMAFVTDPSQSVRTVGDILRALFGLTPAECRVALLLGDGHSPPGISKLIGVSANTLKTQLASIYRKTATSRQSQVVRLLAQLASVIPSR